MKNKPVNLARHIAMRYVRLGKRSQLVAFMSAIAVSGLAAGVAILIIVLSVLNGFDYEMRQNVLGIVPHITIRAEDRLNQEQWDETIDFIAAHDRVAHVAGLAEVTGVIATRNGSQGVLVNGIDIESDAIAGELSRFVTSGAVESLAEQRWSVVLGATLAQRLGVGLGDSIDLFSPSVSINPLTPLATFRSFEVVGIYRVGSEELDGRLAIIPLQSARALFRLRSPYNTLRVSVDDVLQADSVMNNLADAMPPGFLLQSWSAQFGSIYENIRFSRGIIGFMLWLLVGVAAFNLVVNLIMIVRDKTGDIAILRTLGAEPRTIYRIFIWQGVLIGALGLLIGIFLGVLGALNISSFASGLESAFDIQFFNAEVYPIDFLPSQLAMSDVLTVSIGVIILSLLATLYPSRRAAAVNPAAALRAD